MFGFSLFLYEFWQQQSARYFSPHERNNPSPTAANLTVLNAAQCYPPPVDSFLNRPSCLTCPTIGDHCDHPSASTMPPHTPHFHPFHHNAHESTLQLNKSLMTNQHPIYNSCQKWVSVACCASFIASDCSTFFRFSSNLASIKTAPVAVATTAWMMETIPTTSSRRRR